MEPETAVPLTLDTLRALLAPHYLDLLGAFTPDQGDGLPDWVRSVVLIGPAEPGFWTHLTSQPEWADGAEDPVDRWSRRVLGRIACDLDGKAWFPFGGPPYHPFYRWAMRTGRIWESPVRLLVHENQGLMVSFRGALGLRDEVSLPAAVSPCTSCPKPCLTSCPAQALTGAGYDVPTCHAFLDANPQGECLAGGCLVRRACPVSQGYARLPEQSAYHMSRFHRAG